MGLYSLKVKTILLHPLSAPGHTTVPRIESRTSARPNKIPVEFDEE